MTNYTEEAKQRCLALLDADAEAFWADIEQAPSDTTAKKWAKKLNALAQEYTFSSRFALMRLFLDRTHISVPMASAESPVPDANKPVTGLPATLPDGEQCDIMDISMEHAKNLTAEEVQQLETILLHRASLQSDADEAADRALIAKAISPVQKKTTLLSREEALRLGHVLQFSLKEMDWFLLRVFDSEESFRFNSSEDLIHAYCFLTNRSQKVAETLLAEYDKTFAGLPKASFESKPVDWTQDADGSLPGMVNAWAIYDDDTQDKKFLAWLGQRAPYLDLPPKTAVRIYRNLAVYAYNLATHIEAAPDTDTKRPHKDGRKETDFVRCIREVVNMLDYDETTVEMLCQDGVFSPDRCKLVADTLLSENKILFYTHPDGDRVHAWASPKVASTGKVTVNDGKKASRSRVCDILSGSVTQICKADMLYLLWFIANLCWMDARSQTSSEAITDRLTDFIDAANRCLGRAGLSEFYPPHLLEQTMMLSVVHSFTFDEDNDPGYVYEVACAAMRISRMGKKKAADAADTSKKSTTKKAGSKKTGSKSAGKKA